MSDIEFFCEGHVAHVRLNRPKSLNAINSEMDQALHDAWHEINRDPEIWVVVLSAEGERAFCVGADVSGGAERPSRMALGGGLTGVGGPLVKLNKPMIAAVQGYVLAVVSNWHCAQTSLWLRIQHCLQCRKPRPGSSASAVYCTGPCVNCRHVLPWR